MAGKEIPGWARLPIAVVTAGAVGFVGGVAVDGNSNTKYGEAIEQEASEGATGQGYDKKHFNTQTISPVSKSVVSFALGRMVELAGQDDPKELSPKVKAAAACTLLLANGQPMSNEARLAWGSGVSTEDLDQDGAEERADAFFGDAEKACRGPLEAAADAGQIDQLVVPIAPAED